MNIQPRMSLAEKSAFRVLIALRYKGLIWIVLIERFDECNHDSHVSRTLGLSFHKTVCQVLKSDYFLAFKYSDFIHLRISDTKAEVKLVEFKYQVLAEL